MKGTGQPILYLDFDGVLHPDSVYWKRGHGIHLEGEGQLFQHAEALAAALSPHPTVKIVLSTSWVEVLSFKQAKERLPKAIQERIVGGTWHSCFRYDLHFMEDWKEFSRYQQIMSDVARRRPSGWLAVDDSYDDWSAGAREHLIACGHDDGLGDPAVMEELQRQLVALEQGRLPLGSELADAANTRSIVY